MKKLLCLLLCVTMIFCVSCKKEEDVDFHYEVPVETLFEALDSQDSSTFLRCFATPVVSKYENSDSFDENIAKTIVDAICEDCGLEKTVINHKITDKKELSAEEIEALGDGLEKRHKVKKAYELTVRVTALSVKDNEESFSQEMKITVGKISGNWYICQSPEMTWDFVKDVKDVKPSEDSIDN